MEDYSSGRFCASLLDTRNMNATVLIRHWRPSSACFRGTIRPQFFSKSSPIWKAYYSNQAKASHQKADCHSTKAKSTTPAISSSRSVWRTAFWSCRSTWKRAGINTLRCLAGCTLGDFSALWMLQTYYPELGMTTIMAASSKFSPLTFSQETFHKRIRND